MTTDLAIIAMLNALAFWKGGKRNLLFVPVAAIDIIYGLVYAGSGDIPSLSFFVGVAIAILGLYCFIGEFVLGFWRR